MKIEFSLADFLIGCVLGAIGPFVLTSCLYRARRGHWPKIEILDDRDDE